MSSCTGRCDFYENDGVCNVPKPCPQGTDCDDCMTFFPGLEVANVILSFLACLIVVFTAVRRITFLARRGRRDHAGLMK